MFKKSTIALAISTSFFLTGCLEVEDNNNDDIVSAIENQNSLAQEAETATLTGSVKNIVSDSSVSNAQIQIKVGNNWSEPLALTEGSFELPDIPKYSDYILLVTSTDGSFQQRAFYGKSDFGVSQLGTLLVTSTETVEFSALLNGENHPISDLQFSYTTSKGLNNDLLWQTRNEHFITANYNSETNLYSIEKPVGWNYPISIDMDVDNDNVDEYEFTLGNNYDNTIMLSQLNENSTIFFDTADSLLEYQLRIKIINDLGEAFTDLELVATSNGFEANPLTFDSDTSEYIYDYKGSSSLNVRLSAFTDGEQSYASDFFTISEEDNALTVNGIFNQGYYRVEDGVISVVLKPNKETQTSDISLIDRAVNPQTNGYYLFFSKPIELEDDSVTLVKKNVLSVVRGNESDTDSVPDGSTLFKTMDQDIAVTQTMSLNNTFVEILPNQMLSDGDYSYTLNAIIDPQTQLTLNYSYENNFTVNNSTEFLISEIKLDNNNGFKSGELIHTSNTAGETTNVFGRSNDVRLYLPTSIASLSDFSLTVTGYTRFGDKFPLFEEYTIVSNDHIYNNNLVNLASIALNETAYGEQSNVMYYTSLPDGVMYSRNLGWEIALLDDNQQGSVNEVSFEYEYKVKGSKEVISGSITIPVL